MTLTIRTDKPESELGLFDQSGHSLAYQKWQAHRQLAETIHQEISKIIKQTNKSQTDITGIIIYEGPGSFTGLRIGMSVANALAYSLAVPVVATTGDNWLKTGLQSLKTAKMANYAKPSYGADANITNPKK